MLNLSVVIVAYNEERIIAKTLEAIFVLVDKTNKYLNDKKPWDLYKKGKNDEGAIVLYTVLEILRQVTILIQPFVPNIADDIWSQLGFDKSLAELIMF